MQRIRRAAVSNDTECSRFSSRRAGSSVPVAVNAPSFAPNWELTQLLDIFPLAIRQALVRLPNLEGVIEVVLDLGRPAEARFEDDFVFLGDAPITAEDIAHVTSRLSPFGGDNRAGIEQT